MVQIVDASTGQPARRTTVRVTSDNGIRCRRAPCPTNARVWKGISDPQGFVAIPAGILQTTVHVDTDALTGDLIADSAPTKDQTWVVELLPQPSTYTSPPGAPRPLKLIDASTGIGIADSRAHFELRRSDSTQPVFETRSNALGYVFLPFDLPAGALQNTWVLVAGYVATHVDFAGAQHRIALARRSPRSPVVGH